MIARGMNTGMKGVIRVNGVPFNCEEDRDVMALHAVLDVLLRGEVVRPEISDGSKAWKALLSHITSEQSQARDVIIAAVKESAEQTVDEISELLAEPADTFGK